MDLTPDGTAVVTGATSGIGRWIALGLARAGCHVVLVGRNAARGAAALDWIGAQSPGASTELMLADLSLMAETRALGQRIAERHPAISLLVNNAGVFRTRRTETAEGHETVLAVNHLSPFLLTRTLLGALESGARDFGSAGIVNVGSDVSDRARIDPDDLELRRHWGMVRAYGQSKLALMMTTFEWARRLDWRGVTANIVHPGMVATGLVRTSGIIGLSWRLMAPFLRTEEQGARTPLHVCLAPEYAGRTGLYVKNCKPARANRSVEDVALVARVWDATERLIG
jgi:retinol dehydrogenase-12